MNTPAGTLFKLAEGSQTVFEHSEYRGRVSRLRSMLHKIGVDVYIGSTPENLNYFAGFDPLGLYFFQHIFYKTGDEEPSLLTHKCEKELARTQCWIKDIQIWQHGDDALQITIDKLRQLGVCRGSRIGLEMGNWYLKASTYKSLVDGLPGVEFVDVTDEVLKLRSIKSPMEIALMRQAAAFSDMGFSAVVNALAPGVSEAELLIAAQAPMVLAGSEYPTLPFIIGSGPRSGLFHAVPTIRKVQAGEPVMIELTGSWKRYNANIVRTIVVGKASSELLNLRAVVNEAFWRPFELIKPGTPVSEIDRLSREIRRDYDRYIPARAGFGMGLAYPPVWAGRPDVLVGNDEELEEGMIFSLEPSIGQYHGTSMIFGYNILVTATGAEILQKTDKSIFEVGA